MGLLMSDTLLIDPMLVETLRLRDGLSEWTYALAATCDGYEQEAAHPFEWPRVALWSAALATDAEQ